MEFLFQRAFFLFLNQSPSHNAKLLLTPLKLAWNHYTHFAQFSLTCLENIQTILITEFQSLTMEPRYIPWEEKSIKVPLFQKIAVINAMEMWKLYHCGKTPKSLTFLVENALPALALRRKASIEKCRISNFLVENSLPALALLRKGLHFCTVRILFVSNIFFSLQD